nr:hypothetical protein BaRGS_008261 [Batillaria attramentaria]
MMMEMRMIVKFFEVSHLSFVARLGLKAKEGYIKKCSGGRRISIGWLVLKDTYLAYVRPEDGIISDVMLMDSDFKVACGMRDTGAKHGVLISNLNRFVDARSYFEAVAEALEKAKEEIYITDWWLSPEIYLKRPIVDGDHWRLDVILERKAAQGVRVFILLYKEIEAALMIKSIYSKQVLMGKHENIKVLRHPDHIPGKGILLWAHHEKLVAIDQQIAFIGGIDLCYGRWDDGQHRLTDLGSIVLNAPPSPVAPSVISTRREESHVTDMTELTEDLNSLESPASVRTRPTSSSQLSPVPSALSAKTAARVAGSTPKAASHHDVNIKVIPPSPPSESTRAVTESSADDDQQTPVVNPEEIVVKEDASRRHVFAKVLLNSNGEESETETDVDAGLSSSGNGTSTLANSSTVEQESSDADTVREELQSTKSASVDSTTSTGSGKKHLWGNNRLKLKIPGKRGHSQSETPEHANVNGEHGDEVDRIDTVVNSDLCQAEHMPRLRSSSNESQASKTSETALLTRENHTHLYTEPENQQQQQQQPPDSATSGHSTKSSGGRDTMDFKGAVSAMNVFRRMNRGKQEENNNKNRPRIGSSGEGHRASGGSGDGDGDGNSLARRRWKMVFNVQKFESVVRHKQEPERIPEEVLSPGVLLGKDKKRAPTFYQKFKRDNRGSFDVGINDRGLLDILPPGEVGVYRTNSEQDILERGLQGSTKLWIGKDYVNFIHKDFVNLEQPFEDFIDRTQCPRMPWHDIGAVVYGKTARDVARHFIGRWNYTKLLKYKRNPLFPLLLPKTYPKMNIPQVIKDITFSCKAQVLRSLCGWSAGIEGVEKSIHEAYEFCIENAKNYIYIENQFFITQVGDTSTVGNCIGTALFKRILRAYRSGEEFRVYVVMPLLPAFEGEFGTASGASLQAITHWNYVSMCRSESSLIKNLEREVPDPYKYIVFCGLRTWDKLDKKLVTELIYVHSKLMIVDDNTVIIGSANINDRSMLGKRDSELAIIFQDTERERVVSDNHILEPGPFASSLRHTIFREHLGIKERDTDVDLKDITSDTFYKDVWIRRAAVNSSTYDKVFRCLPTDHVHTFQELKQYNAQPNMATTDPDEALTHLSKVQGHLVLMPLMFLKDESLTPRVGQKEALLPSYLWT